MDRTEPDDICFMDTETLGLDEDAPVWEFAAIRMRGKDEIYSSTFFIQHDPTGWLDDFPAEFRKDYDARFDAQKAWSADEAAQAIHEISKGAHVVGAVPSFDTIRLTKLLKRFDIVPAWHYHLLDAENVAVGYLGALAKLLPGRGYDKLIEPPFDSEELSEEVGVHPGHYDRHTAMGDVFWARDIWFACRP